MPNIQPMLACSCTKEQLAKKLPFYIQPKLDGVRVIIKDGVALSKKLKPIRNKHIQKIVYQNRHFVNGCDGEMVVGSATDENVFNSTQAIMRIEGEPNFRYHVYDFWSRGDAPYDRDVLKNLQFLNTTVSWISSIPSILCETMEDVNKYEDHFLKEGYEGAMARGLTQGYKFGRSTFNQGQLIKIKRFTDTEARVIAFHPKMHNANEATKDALGRSKRSSHKENMVALDTLGNIECQGVFKNGTEYTVSIGTGFDDETRKHIWENQDMYMGKLAKFKYFENGTKDAPRFPVFIGWRDEDDM